MVISIGNLPPGVSAEELREVLEQHGLEGVLEVNILEGSGNQPGALIKMDISAAAAKVVVARVTHIYWKGHNLTCTPLLMFRE
ncbi:MAG TPA: RNA-binding protein [Candidatus Competibacteraceae bacterium]|nr:RNA-binding protein [Candidatus Competibacteraceae bacterium]